MASIPCRGRLRQSRHPSYLQHDTQLILVSLNGRELSKTTIITLQPCKGHLETLKHTKSSSTLTILVKASGDFEAYHIVEHVDNMSMQCAHVREHATIHVRPTFTLQQLACCDVRLEEYPSNVMILNKGRICVQNLGLGSTC